MSSASLPPRQSSQRRPSPEQTNSSSTSSPPASSPSLARTDDSEPLVLQQPQESTEDSNQQEEEQQQQQPSNPSLESETQLSSAQNLQTSTTAEDDSEPKKCWICFADATEDTPETSPWRDPCPCALLAHEECLLDWIADMEAPNRTRNRPNGNRIECPQCKSEIQLSRPKSLVVDAVRGLERVSAKLVTPGALTVLFGTLYQSSVALGIHSIYAVFGANDGFRILEPLLINRIRPPINLEMGASAQDVGQALLGSLVDRLVHWRLYVGLPLITPVLMLSRTSLADTLLPTLPIVFFASQAHGSSRGDVLQIGKWPPTAPFAFAMLPYVRALYNYYYTAVWEKHEKRWLREIQPRAGHDGEGEDGGGAAAEQNNPAAVERDDGNLFEIRIDGWDGWDEEQEEVLLEEAERIEREADGEAQLRPQPGDGAAAPPPGQDQAGAQQLPPQQQQQQQQQQGQQQNPNPEAAAAAAAANADGGVAQGERRLSFSPTAIAEKVIGALLFPSIAGCSGELLRLALPRSWTSPTIGGGGSSLLRRGLLQEKWGRTIVGGCLFVFFKDAVLLYVRWKMAQMHRHRRVVDFDRGKAKGRKAAR